MMHVFCVAENTNGKLSDMSFELLNLANTIKGEGKSSILVLGRNIGVFADELSKYADTVLAIDDEGLSNYNPELYSGYICNTVQKNDQALILFGDTPFGREVAPYLAAKLKAPVQTDVVAVDLSDGVSISRHLWQDKVMVDMKLAGSDFYVLTVRQNVFKTGPEVGGEIIQISDRLSLSSKRRFVRYIEPESGVGAGDVDITKKDVLVTVGRGIGGASNIKMAEDLAELLGGAVAASRPVVDNGWLPQSRQVGVSGKMVRPKLYISLGVSGSTQHVAGMNNSELVIAVNKDPEAPIFQVAHYYVCGDMFAILPGLIDKLRQNT